VQGQEVIDLILESLKLALGGVAYLFIDLFEDLLSFVASLTLVFSIFFTNRRTSFAAVADKGDELLLILLFVFFLYIQLCDLFFLKLGLFDLDGDFDFAFFDDLLDRLLLNLNLFVF
jgi:hypothetical protein